LTLATTSLRDGLLSAHPEALGLAIDGGEPFGSGQLCFGRERLAANAERELRRRGAGWLAHEHDAQRLMRELRHVGRGQALAQRQLHQQI
jgi:hypothetical protein